MLPQLPSRQFGARFGPYAILPARGAGGMSKVYRVHDAKIERDVAIIRPRPLQLFTIAIAGHDRHFLNWRPLVGGLGIRGSVIMAPGTFRSR